MICFQDRTFCKDPECAGRCGFQAWTPELAMAADRWWRGEPGTAPVAFIEHDYKRGL